MEDRSGKKVIADHAVNRKVNLKDTTAGKAHMQEFHHIGQCSCTQAGLICHLSLLLAGLDFLALSVTANTTQEMVKRQKDRIFLLCRHCFKVISIETRSYLDTNTGKTNMQNKSLKYSI